MNEEIELKKLLDEQRKVKFKVMGCPMIIFKRFQRLASTFAGNNYPVALAMLLDAFEENKTKQEFILELGELKTFIGELQAEVEILREKINSTPVTKKIKTFGA